MNVFTLCTRSVHNTRIERLWYDVTRGFGIKWKNFFLELERTSRLDADSPAHLWLVHHLFLAAINQDAYEWAEAWNAHRLHIRDEPSASPRELFMFGMLRHGARGIEHITTPQEEEVDDIQAYGVDWDVINDPVLMEHHRTHNPASEPSAHLFAPAEGPNHLSQVTCDPPLCPLHVDQVAMLNAHLTYHFDLTTRDMLVRKSIWEAALDYCTRMF